MKPLIKNPCIMIREKTDIYIKICMKTWLLCESCIHAEENSPVPRYDLIVECNACAKSCFAVVSKLVSETEIEDMSDTILNCLLHCRQCAMECGRYEGEEDITLCADVCQVCGDAIRELACFSLN